MEIAQLRPYQTRVEIAFKVLEKSEPREVTGRLDGTQHSVAEALIADKTGLVLLTLWNQDIEKIEEGKCYKLENGKTSLFKNSLRVSIGRFGKISEVDDIGEVNRENNLSEKEFSH